MEPKEIKAVIECLLFVADKPMSVATLQSLLEDVDRRTILACLDELKAEYDLQGRAFHLVEIAEGYQLATRVQYAPWIRKMFKSRTSNKLSRAALETLAIIAYRQPITKAEIEDIRGVSADGVANALLDRKFIRIVGRKEVVGRPILYGTTKEFLHYFGLKDLTDMPMLKDLQDILESDETGKAWELNAQGELVAKIRSGEESEFKAGSMSVEPVAETENTPPETETQAVGGDETPTAETDATEDYVQPVADMASEEDFGDEATQAETEPAVAGEPTPGQEPPAEAVAGQIPAGDESKHD